AEGWSQEIEYALRIDHLGERGTCAFIVKHVNAVVADKADPLIVGYDVGVFWRRVDGGKDTKPRKCPTPGKQRACCRHFAKRWHFCVNASWVRRRTVSRRLKSRSYAEVYGRRLGRGSIGKSAFGVRDCTPVSPI